MRILLTGANGYIGTRLLPLLIAKGHEVIALVRDVERLQIPEYYRHGVIPLQGDLLSLDKLPEVEAAYYLVHAMSDDPEIFSSLEKRQAAHFVNAIKQTHCKQIIYLSGLSQGKELSPHMESRKQVENILRRSGIPLTVLRASVIIGSGSASFEMIRDLSEKLPIMVAPRWVRKKCQPIAITDVLAYLAEVLGHPACMGKTFEIAGPEKISYGDMLQRYAKMRGLKRVLIPVPVLTPRLSSYWLIFITSTNYYLARSLIDSLRNDSIKKESSIDKVLPRRCLSYEEALARALQKIQQNAIVSSWRDTWTPSDNTKFIEVPKMGCLSKSTYCRFSGDPDTAFSIFKKLGKEKGYYMSGAWPFREKASHERKHPREELDFWQVLIDDTPTRRLVLYSKVKLPGEAWLELKIYPEEKHFVLLQIATFRPKGLLGRLYWYCLYPIHTLIFLRIGKKLLQKSGAKIL